MTRVLRKGRMGGNWIRELGYNYGDVLTVHAHSGEIVYQFHENGIARTLELVKFARRNKLKLIQVRKNGGLPFIEIPETSRQKAGFMPGERLCATFEDGVLKLQPLNS